MYSSWSLFLLHTEKAGSLLWKGNIYLKTQTGNIYQLGMVKIETRLLSFAPGKIEKMETTQTGDGGRYNSG